MNIENQVVSVELAKRLKELNCKQESLWYWEVLGTGGYYVERGIPSHRNSFPAFTVAELYQIHWEMFGRFPSVIGLKPNQIADYLAKEIINELLIKRGDLK